jgi:hypothetical protein
MSSSTGLSGSRIRHTVVFALPHGDRSPEETSFLTALTALGSIDGVEAFEVVREVSAKNDYRWGVSMEFADQSAYDAYNVDPRHVSFVRDRWVPEVTEFLEVDFVAR